jgi:hypothetical protein
VTKSQENKLWPLVSKHQYIGKPVHLQLGWLNSSLFLDVAQSGPHVFAGYMKKQSALPLRVKSLNPMRLEILNWFRSRLEKRFYPTKSANHRAKSLSSF